MKKFIHIAQPHFDKEEKREIIKAMESGWVTLGPLTKKFEENFAEYVGSKYAVGVTSCTGGLHLSLIAAGISEGDEVITTPFTFTATASVIHHVGARPVFVDVDEKTFNIDIDKIEKKITKKTKAIIPVHYAGQPVDIDSVHKIAKKHNLIVIEDAAHAAGALYKSKKIGSLSDFTVFSFHPIKNMTTGDGGMITTNNQKYAEKLASLRLHGMTRDAWKRHTATGTWQYDIETPGFKYNMTDIAAALGIHQLKKLNKFISRRKEIAAVYNSEFSKIPEITIPFVKKNSDHIFTLYTILINTKNLKITRDEIVEELKKAGIGAHIQFIPLHYLTFYKKEFGYKKGDFPVSEGLFEKILSLPIYPKMTKSDVSYVIKTLKKIITNSHY